MGVEPKLGHTSRRALSEASHCLHWLSESAQTLAVARRFSSNVARRWLAGFSAGAHKYPRASEHRVTAAGGAGPGGSATDQEAPVTRARAHSHAPCHAHQLHGSPGTPEHFLPQLSKETIGEKFTARREVETSKLRSQFIQK